MKLDGSLKIRIEQDKVDAFKDRCNDIGVRYTVVLRNLIQKIIELPDDNIQILGRKK